MNDMDLLEIFKDSEDVVEFPAGAVIIEEGQEGDLMYVVMAGEVLISLKGRQLATASPAKSSAKWR
jgi:CRP-like cAMP-binding protein